MAEERTAVPSTRARARRVLTLLAAGVLVAAAACSGDDGGGADDLTTTDPAVETADDGLVETEPDDDTTDDEPSSTDDTPPATDAPVAEPSSYSIEPPDRLEGVVGVGDAGEGAADDEPIGFAGPVELIDHGVETGAWTEAEGAIAVLRAQLGETPRSSVGGLELVITPSRSSLLHLAEDLIDDDATSADDRAELERLVGNVVPPLEFFDSVDDEADDGDRDGDDGEPTGLRRAAPDTTPHPGQAGDCVEPNVSAFPFVEELAVDCWRLMTQNVTRGASAFSRLRIVYPAASEAQATATMEALVRSVEAGHEWSDANPDTSVLISPDPAATGDDDDGDVWGAASGVTDRHCAMSLFSSDSGSWDESYQQMVAHEQVHCLQFADFGHFTGADDWFIEGGAEYFSHVIYPEGGNEREFVTAFMTESLTTALPDMSYQAWPWWQHLGNLSSPEAVFDLHRRMAAGDGVAVLAAEPGMAGTFQDFTIDLMTEGIPTESAPIEPSPLGNDAGVVDATGERSETVEQFVAARFGLRYVSSHLFEQTDHTASDGLMQMVPRDERMDRAAWRGLPPEIRTTCTDDDVYLMVATTVSTETHTVEWSVDTADEYDCDPCLGGTWLLDNASFRDLIDGIISSQGGMPAEAGAISWDLVGPYYLRFAEDGSGTAWREDWRMIAGGTIQGVTAEVVTSMSSIETFDYGADGERFEASNAITVDSRTTVEMGGLPISATSSPSSTEVSLFGNTSVVEGTGTGGPQRAGGTYTCDEHRLVIAMDEAPESPIAWDRVDDIPEPPVVITDDGSLTTGGETETDEPADD